MSFCASEICFGPIVGVNYKVQTKRFSFINKKPPTMFYKIRDSENEERYLTSYFEHFELGFVFNLGNRFIHNKCVVLIGI